MFPQANRYYFSPFLESQVILCDQNVKPLISRIVCALSFSAAQERFQIQSQAT